MTPANTQYRILVGVDYSKSSELALERALELAAASVGGEVHVVHVASTHYPDSPTEDPTLPSQGQSARTRDADHEQLEMYVSVSLAGFKKKHLADPGREFRTVTHLRTSAPTREIAQLASDLEADLVVVGMHGRSALSHFFLGSVAESVARLSPCPVLIFRPKGAAIEYPKIEPPCPQCLTARVTSGGAVYWCEQHRERHGQRHTYHQRDRASEAVNSPLVLGNLTGNH